MRCVRQGCVEGTIAAPPSKSAAQRAIALATLASGRSRIRTGVRCDDVEAALRAALSLGACVEDEGDYVTIMGGKTPARRDVDCGESGLVMRLFAPIAALYGSEHRLVAGGTLSHRSMVMVEEPLRALGARCETRGGLPPVTVRGPIAGGAVTVDASQSSQFLSGLLTALPICPKPSVVACSRVASRPYVEMTLDALAVFGVRVVSSPDLSSFCVPGGQRPSPAAVDIEGDWSGAAFLLAAGAIAGEVTVTGLLPRSRQADRRVLDALRRAGARVRVAGDAVTVTREGLRAFEMDIADSPDLFPPLVALAACCEGESRLHGASRLVGKESDRRASLVEELSGLGACVRAEGDLMRVEGRALRGGKMCAQGDHRIAMAGAVVALACEEGVEIEGEACVSKSYPRFFEDLGRLRARIS